MGGAYAGHLDFIVHPDEQALSVSGLEVSPEYQERNLAAVMMDALYAAYPTAWIDHGGRGPDGTLWWDRYSDPAPERNVHNRPMAEWVVYFEALRVAGQKVQNALQNRYLGVDGHRDAAYRYGESLEDEARRYAPAFREPPVQGPDPAAAELYGGMRLVLPPRYHQIVHNSSLNAGERAEILLSQLGHGNLPFGATWSTTEHAAFGVLAHRPSAGLVRIRPDRLARPRAERVGALDDALHLAAVGRFRAEGHEIKDEDAARLSPLEHASLKGSYSFMASIPARRAAASARPGRRRPRR
ncbi:hypothetical protein OHB03_44255 [Streptomyces sp. NBC_01643]|nr:hypothetical protein OHB03_44255 [Streptomyces sp. NBC_01643]